MVNIIHGDDTAASRKYFIEQRSTFSDSISVNGATVTLTEIVQIFEGDGLFSDGKHVFIEEFFSKRKAGKEIQEIIEVISKNTDSDVFFWESKDVTAKQLGSFKGSINKQFKIPKVLFSFLDNLKPGNGKIAMQLFHQGVQTEAVELLFFMMIRHFRLLLALSDNTTENIEEVKRMAPWQKGKMQKQAHLFKVDNLKEIYIQLYQLELTQKTGGLTGSLEQSIDFLLVGL